MKTRGTGSRGGRGRRRIAFDVDENDPVVTPTLPQRNPGKQVGRPPNPNKRSQIISSNAATNASTNKLILNGNNAPSTTIVTHSSGYSNTMTRPPPTPVKDLPMDIRAWSHIAAFVIKQSRLGEYSVGSRVSSTRVSKEDDGESGWIYAMFCADEEEEEEDNPSVEGESPSAANGETNASISGPESTMTTIESPLLLLPVMPSAEDIVNKHKITSDEFTTALIAVQEALGIHATMQSYATPFESYPVKTNDINNIQHSEGASLLTSRQTSLHEAEEGLRACGAAYTVAMGAVPTIPVAGSDRMPLGGRSVKILFFTFLHLDEVRRALTCLLEVEMLLRPILHCPSHRHNNTSSLAVRPLDDKDADVKRSTNAGDVMSPVIGAVPFWLYFPLPFRRYHDPLRGMLIRDGRRRGDGGDHTGIDIANNVIPYVRTTREISEFLKWSAKSSSLSVSFLSTFINEGQCTYRGIFSETVSSSGGPVTPSQTPSKYNMIGKVPRQCKLCSDNIPFDGTTLENQYHFNILLPESAVIVLEKGSPENVAVGLRMPTLQLPISFPSLQSPSSVMGAKCATKDSSTRAVNTYFPLSLMPAFCRRVINTPEYNRYFQKQSPMSANIDDTRMSVSAEYERHILPSFSSIGVALCCSHIPSMTLIGHLLSCWKASGCAEDELNQGKQHPLHNSSSDIGCIATSSNYCYSYDDNIVRVGKAVATGKVTVLLLSEDSTRLISDTGCTMGEGIGKRPRNGDGKPFETSMKKTQGTEGGNSAAVCVKIENDDDDYSGLVKSPTPQTPINVEHIVNMQSISATMSCEVTNGRRDLLSKIICELHNDEGLPPYLRYVHRIQQSVIHSNTETVEKQQGESEMKCSDRKLNYSESVHHQHFASIEGVFPTVRDLPKTRSFFPGIENAIDNNSSPSAVPCEYEAKIQCEINEEVKRLITNNTEKMRTLYIEAAKHSTGPETTITSNSNGEIPEKRRHFSPTSHLSSLQHRPWVKPVLITSSCPAVTLALLSPWLDMQPSRQHSTVLASICREIGRVLEAEESDLISLCQKPQGCNGMNNGKNTNVDGLGLSPGFDVSAWKLRLRRHYRTRDYSTTDTPSSQDTASRTPAASEVQNAPITEAKDVSAAPVTPSPFELHAAVSVDTLLIQLLLEECNSHSDHQYELSPTSLELQSSLRDLLCQADKFDSITYNSKYNDNRIYNNNKLLPCIIPSLHQQQSQRCGFLVFYYGGFSRAGEARGNDFRSGVTSKKGSVGDGCQYYISAAIDMISN